MLLFGVMERRERERDICVEWDGGKYERRKCLCVCLLCRVGILCAYMYVFLN